MEYKYTQNPNAKRPIILVDKYIGTDAAGVTGIDGGQFAREVLALKNDGKTEVEVWINSRGGSLSDGFNIYGSLKNSGLHVTTVNMGAVDSTAGWIYQAGDHRVWMNYGLGLIHNVQGAGQNVDAANISVATMLASRGNKTVDECLELMASNTTMTAAIASDYGFYDELRNCNEVLSLTNSSDIKEVTDFGDKQTKKLLPKHKSMSTVNQLLGLTNEASEAAQFEAINNLVSAKNSAEQQVKDKDKEILTLTNAKADAETKLTEAQNTILEATNASNLLKAEALIAEHKGKRLVDTPENLLTWTNAAVKDYDGTKAMIEAINLNVVAPNPNAAAGQGDAAPTTAAGFMATKQKEVADRRK